MGNLSTLVRGSFSTPSAEKQTFLVFFFSENCAKRGGKNICFFFRMWFSSRLLLLITTIFFLVKTAHKVGKKKTERDTQKVTKLSDYSWCANQARNFHANFLSSSGKHFFLFFKSRYYVVEASDIGNKRRPTQPPTVECKVEAQSEYAHVAHTFFARFRCRRCLLSRCLSTKLFASEPVRKFVKSALLVGHDEDRRHFCERWRHSAPTDSGGI